MGRNRRSKERPAAAGVLVGRNDGFPIQLDVSIRKYDEQPVGNLVLS
jgi:hypothetical protein